MNGPATLPWTRLAVPAWWSWLQSGESSWLTGQILRVDGHKLSRIEGYTEAAHRYHAKDAVVLTPP